MTKKLAASNIAWRLEDASGVYAEMARLGYTGLEIAPGLMFPDGDPVKVRDTEIKSALAPVRDAGLQLVSMQGLLFGWDHAKMFTTSEARDLFMQRMKDIISLAGRLQIRNLVFGCPKNRRYPESLSEERARHLACEMFSELGDTARANDCYLALEPNPADYETNFMNHLTDVMAVVEQTAHSNVSINLDFGAMVMNSEAEQTLEQLDGHVDSVTHFHVSEPFLAPAPAEEHRQLVSDVFETVKRSAHKPYISLEMKRPVTNGTTDLAVLYGKLAVLASVAL